MLIESRIRRATGTRVTLDGVEYHFQSSGDDPRHVAEVVDPAHVAAFLRVTEGYLALPDPAPTPALEPIPKRPRAKLDGAA
ncbi:MAG: hypothetical protein MZV65_39375 [Chromatiales bacterium]|nr:hypothetical protein [Chromatiales bacterium]MCK7581097.1 hypothetical protein [Chromatiales bacterium]